MITKNSNGVHQDFFSSKSEQHLIILTAIKWLQKYTLDQNDGIFLEFVVLCCSLESLTSYSTKLMKEPIFCKKLATYSLKTYTNPIQARDDVLVHVSGITHRKGQTVLGCSD